MYTHNKKITYWKVTLWTEQTKLHYDTMALTKYHFIITMHINFVMHNPNFLPSSRMNVYILHYLILYTNILSKFTDYIILWNCLLIKMYWTHCTHISTKSFNISSYDNLGGCTIVTLLLWRTSSCSYLVSNLRKYFVLSATKDLGGISERCSNPPKSDGLICQNSESISV